MLGGLYWLLLPKMTGKQGGDAHEEGDAGDQLGRGVGVGDLTEEVAVQDQTQDGSQYDYREDEGQPDGQVLVLDQQGEDEGRHVGLGPEGEVEDTCGLVGEDQPHGHHGIGAAVGNAGDGEAQEMAHSRAASYSGPAAVGVIRPGCLPAQGPGPGPWRSG